MLGKSLFHGRLLDGEAEIGHAELTPVGTRRILRDEFGTRGVDRLAMHRHRIGQIPRHRAGLAIAVSHHAMLQRDADDAAGEIDRPADAVGVVAADLVDGRKLRFGEILVPAQLLEHAIGEFGITVGQLRTLAVGAFGQQIDVLHRAVRLLLLVHHAKTRAERAAAVLGMKVGVVERMRARMPDLRRAPAWPWQAIIVAADLGLVGLGAQRHQVELALVLHVRLQPLRRLAGVAGREAAAVDFAQQVFGRGMLVLDLDILEHLVGEAEFLGKPVDDLVVVLRFEDRLDDLLAPLQ